MRPKLHPTNVNILPEENSQDVKYNMIVNRAQQQLDSDEISLEQYNSVIKQVMQIQTQHNRKRKSESKLSLTQLSDDENGLSSSSAEIDRHGRHNRLRKRDRKSSESSDHNENNSSASKASNDAPTKSKFISEFIILLI